MRRNGLARPIPLAGLACGLGACLLAGCHTDMWRQPKVLPQQPFTNAVFADGMADRQPVEGTIAWGRLRQGDPRVSAFQDGKLVETLPPFLEIAGERVSTAAPADLEKVLRRGKERFEAFCTHCHGALGDGNGMITQRGLALRRKPASYHTDRLRQMPIGHFFDVITRGYGVMFAYGSRVDVDDRWAIAAYIRALQLSRHAKAEALPGKDRDELLSVQESADGNEEAHAP